MGGFVFIRGGSSKKAEVQRSMLLGLCTTREVRLGGGVLNPQQAQGFGFLSVEAGERGFWLTLRDARATGSFFTMVLKIPRAPRPKSHPWKL